MKFEKPYPGWRYKAGCDCPNCVAFVTDELSGPMGRADFAADFVVDKAGNCSRGPGHEPPCNGFPVKGCPVGGYSAMLEGANIAQALVSSPTGLTRGENPKDRLGIAKLPLRLIPPPALAYLSRVMGLGADKYGPYNWRQNKVKRSVYLEAALRHILTALDGEDIDVESGMPHEAHAMACMAILLDAHATGNLIDDRPTPGVFGRLVQQMQKKVG